HDEIFGNPIFDDDKPVDQCGIFSPTFVPCEICKERNDCCYACTIKRLLNLLPYKREKQQQSHPDIEMVETVASLPDTKEEYTCPSNFGSEVPTGLYDSEAGREYEALSEGNSESTPPDDLIFLHLPKPNHYIQVLNSLGNYKSKPPKLSYLSRLGTSRVVYELSYQRGTAHSIGFWVTSYQSSVVEDILGDWLWWKIRTIRRDGFLNFWFTAREPPQHSSLDVDYSGGIDGGSQTKRDWPASNIPPFHSNWCASLLSQITPMPRDGL
ncbi:hypothetical protein BX600DRAFT_520964, partial [Xylariales sp. PMI_506]